MQLCYVEEDIDVESALERLSREEKLSSKPYLVWLEGSYRAEIRILDRKLKNSAASEDSQRSRRQRRDHLANHCLPFVQEILLNERRRYLAWAGFIRDNRL